MVPHSPFMEFKLNSGYKIPAIGIGTWELNDKKVLLDALEAAYEIGYRHIDTAAFYGNEEVIGEFLKRHKREEIFITTKLWNEDHDDVLSAVNLSLKKLQIEYVDLYLVHWPVNFKSEFDVKKLWSQMESLVELKKAKSIGVSNFGIKNLSAILSFCKIKPAANQIELHPYLPQEEIRAFCKVNNIQVISYSSLGTSSGRSKTLKSDPNLLKIANAHNKCVPQVILSYLVSEGVCVIPKSKSKEHLKSNFELLNLSDAEKNEIRAIKTRIRYVDPSSFGQHRFD